MADKQLPHDAMEEILSRLPVKPLMRFRCLNKPSYSLIKNRSFINKHFQHSKERPGMLIFHYNGGFRATMISDEKPMAAIDLELPRLSDKIVGEITPYGPCNGICCLDVCYHDGSSELCLWNPATKEVKVLPLPHHHNCSAGEFLIHGFGFVPETNDYKVVSLVAAMDFDIEHSKPFSAEVYCLSSNSWREINVTESAYSLVSPSFGSYVKGIYHWLTLGLQDEAIICFDMSTDSFSKMKLPTVSENFSFQQITDCNIAAINDSIAYVKEYSLNFLLENRIEIWVMNEYGVEDSWTRRYVIGPGLGLLKFLGFSKEDEVLTGEDNQRLISYNPDAHQQVQEFPINVGPAMFQAFRYVESVFPISVLNEE